MKNLINKSTILVVDDNKENLKVVGNLLKELNYNLAFALSGKEAIEMLQTTKVDLILLDIMMPGMDGFEVCFHLKQDKKTKDIPVIFLTAKSETDDVVTGFLTGGVDYVTKPFKKEELICRVNTHLELKAARETIQRQALELQESNRTLMRVLFDYANINAKTGQK
jgi:two-component system, sensor histidine kinase and response regulator